MQHHASAPNCATSGAAVSADSLVFRYPHFTLGPVTFALAKGERCGVIGANGSGKSTLLGIMAGQLSPASGVARIGGCETAGDLVAVRAAVACVGERLLCCPWLTATQHFDLQRRFYPAWDASTAREMARALSLPLDIPLGTLSRGNSMKAALCSAVAQRAEVLLLDEPTAGLDPVARTELLRLLSAEAATRAGLTTLFATHILEDLDDFGATSLVVLRQGTVSVVRPELVPAGASMRTLAHEMLLASAAGEVR